MIKAHDKSKTIIWNRRNKILLNQALTDKVNDREVYMKGIDASYHYEGYNVYMTENIHEEPKKPPHRHDRDAR